MRKNLWVRVGALAIAAAMVLGNGTALASAGSENAAKKAAAYLTTQIHDDGGFGSPESSVVSTAIAVVSYKAANMKLPASKTGKTPLDYLETAAPALKDKDAKIVVTNASKIAHVIIAVKVAGKNPKEFAGIDWVDLLKNSGEKATGWYGTTQIDHMWAMLALETAGEEVSANSVNWLKNNQEDNGGYALDKKIGGMGSDTNSTALAIQALIGAGEKKTDPSVKKAIEYLKTQQNKDGGFPFVTPSPYGTDSDSSSTAWVIQALVAAEEDIEGKAWVKTSITPIGFLMSLQNADGGLMYQKAVPDSNLLSTNQAIPAMMLKPFPLKAEAPVVNVAKVTKEKSQLWLYLGLAAGVLLVAILGILVLKKKA